ncbi:pentapeptide repeat-containing protein [Nodosilinea sp. P-1105]|uniref:pentapeptide repeat-containing protein n=1 Tax=Nodosilinea sp. P-1105 TaxID=2546229 RepID=UPI00146E445F|nr:pentapeptide repeat-containing protein [Nodosilinea sp. P-1105]NMF83200.1 pentapeptide repeat-containing protein [Nodosilinea sp. P-1105]
MTNSTHLMHLKRNVEHWNRWRTENPSLQPDLKDAYLCAAALSAANLSHSQLTKADLYSADLWGADLSGADARAANFSSANLIAANLTAANLAEADLIGANLSQADLSQANLHQANLSMANLAGADLSAADLTGANFKGAKLTNAKLSAARLTGANLTGIMVTDLDISLVANLQQVICDHVYVLSCVPQSHSPDTNPTNTYTTHFRAELHQFYQRFVATCDHLNSPFYRIAWPTGAASQGPEIAIQSVERQADGGFLVRVGLSSLGAAVPATAPKPNYQQLISTLGRGDYYRQQLQLKEAQIATYQRQNDELLELLKAMSRQNVYVQSVSVLENSIMTGVSKYDLRGANIGSFADTIEAGGQQQSVQYNQHSMDTVPDWNVAIEMEQIFQYLSHKAAQVPAHQRPQVVANVIKKKASTNPDFKARFLKAVEAGSSELVRVFTKNPYISVPMALVKGWVSAT